MSADDRAQAAADRLLLAFPQWYELWVREVTDSGTEYVALDVSAPSGADVSGLSIDTAGDEITVHFDHWHSHFEYVDHDEGFFPGIASAIDFVNRLVAEDVAIFTWFAGDEWLGSTEMDRAISVESMWNELCTGPSPGMHTCTRIRVRSWAGTLDFDGPPPTAGGAHE